MRVLRSRCTFFLVAIVCVAGCRPKASNDAASSGGNDRLFAVSFMTLNNPFFVDLGEGIRTVVEAHGDRLVVLDSQFNALKQKNDISDVLQQAPGAVFINPVNWEGVRATLVEAQRQKVPIVVVDTQVADEAMVLTQVASDNIAAGRLACEALGKAKPAAKLVILHHSVAKSCIDRVAGFKDTMAKSFPQMQLLDTQEGKGSREGALPVMRDLLGRFPEVDAVFAINDPSALGAISAIESAGKANQISVVTVDGSADGIAAVQAGRLLSTSAQFPKEIGRIAAEKAYEHLAGKPVEREVKVEVKLITR
ncbi:MAG TPA: sugar ABC transporter substrate-binding protein, partial [Chthoniobacteraceae bacterium]|nr:sugar ABC transporter substrate-binding protein [Chthoniobacteraceae bacterium]